MYNLCARYDVSQKKLWTSLLFASLWLTTTPRSKRVRNL